MATEFTYDQLAQICHGTAIGRQTGHLDQWDITTRDVIRVGRRAGAFAAIVLLTNVRTSESLELGYYSQVGGGEGRVTSARRDGTWTALREVSDPDPIRNRV